MSAQQDVTTLLAHFLVGRKHYDDCNPNVGMGPSLSMLLDDILEETKVKIDKRRYNVVLERAKRIINPPKPKPHCICGARMVVREGPHGKFYGCPKWTPKTSDEHPAVSLNGMRNRTRAERDADECALFDDDYFDRPF